MEIVEDILSTRVDETTGAIMAQTGDGAAEEVSGDEAEVFYPPGFASRPADPDDGVCAQAVVEKTSCRDRIVGVRDLRNADRQGALRPGETSTFATVGTARAVHKDDGSTTIFWTANNEESGDSCSASFGPAGIVIAHAFGTLKWDEDGFVLRDKSGATLGLVAVEGVPGVGSVIKSVAKLKADAVHVDGATILVGRGPAFLPAAVAAAPNPVPVPLNPTGGSTSVMVST